MGFGGSTADQGQDQGAGHRGQGRVARFHFEVFKAPKTSKITFLQRPEPKGRAGQGAGQGRRQGAGHRAQGQGTKGKAGLQDSILRFSRPENPKITVLQLFEERGRGSRAGHASLACPRSLGVLGFTV